MKKKKKMNMKKKMKKKKMNMKKKIYFLYINSSASEKLILSRKLWTDIPVGY